MTIGIIGAMEEEVTLLKEPNECSNYIGGEPLMNFDVVKQLVAYGRERKSCMTSISVLR